MLAKQAPYKHGNFSVILVHAQKDGRFLVQNWISWYRWHGDTCILGTTLPSYYVDYEGYKV